MGTCQWRDLEKHDPSVLEDLSSKDDIIILKRTIRDYSEDVNLRDILEQDKIAEIK